MSSNYYCANGASNCIKNLLINVSGVFVYFLFLLVSQSSAQQSYHTVGGRVPGGLVSYNDRLRIDGNPVEHWKHTVGDLAVMKCITGQTDYPIFVWQKDGKSLPEDIRMYELVSNGNSFIEIKHINENHEGKYICSVSNDYGVAKKEYKICVIKPGKKEDCPSWWYKWRE